MNSASSNPLSGIVRRAAVLVVLATMAGTNGCGPQPVTGGTAGVLRSGGQALAEVQVTLHRQEGASWKVIGFADTATDGSFELVTPGAAGPLALPPGEYRATLESVGAPVQIPTVYSNPESSPLVISCSGGDDKLNLEIAETLIR
jgi:hypothetical protein